jgi:ketosteroid isomerase-like protein
MPQQNAEVLRMMVEPFNRGDYEDGLQYYDPDVELRPGVLTPDQQTVFRGRDGMKDFLVGATEAWESVRVERKAILEAAADRFLTLDHWVFRGRDGIEIRRDLPTVYTFRDGLIVRIDGFLEEGDARQAVGLDEDRTPEGSASSEPGAGR